MPIRKFRAVDEMNKPVWRVPGDPVLYEAIAGLWETGTRLRPRRFPPGVHRFRTIGELEDAADAIEHGG